MKHTLSYNRQLFNVKAIAEAGLTPEMIPDNTLGIINVATDKTVAPTSYDDLPATFRIIHKFEGKVFFSFDCINKEDIVWTAGKVYTKAKQNKWEGVIEYCDCIESATLNVFIQEDSLNRALGLPYGTNDFYVGVTPEEMKCYCSCGEAGVYANNVLTMLIYKQILTNKSSFYTAEVETVDGTKFNSFAEVEAFVKANKAVNTDADAGNDGKKLKLILIGKEMPLPKRFNPYNVDYRYPSGVMLLPSIHINGGKHKIAFKEIQKMEYAIGEGLDLVYEEHMNRGQFMNIRDYARNMCPIEFPEYQFEERKKYDTVTLEFDSSKTLRAGEADKKRFMIVFGSEEGLRTDTYDKLLEIFTKK